MISPVQQNIVRKLSAILELSNDVRVGQLMGLLGMLSEDMFNRNIWDVDDDELLQVVERHCSELHARRSSVA